MKALDQSREDHAMHPLTCKGFTAGGVAAGIKKNGNLDLGMLASDRPARVAAVFTKNRVQAAPVTLDRERVRSGMARAVGSSGCPRAIGLWCSGAWSSWLSQTWLNDP